MINQIYAAIKTVIDPELGINIVDLGLIYDVQVEDSGNVTIKMTLTTPGCPLHDSIINGVKYAVQYLEEVNRVNVEVVWEPAWSPERLSIEGKRMLGHV